MHDKLLPTTEMSGGCTMKKLTIQLPHCMHFAQEILISLVSSKVVVVLVFSTHTSCYELSNNDASYSIYTRKVN